MSISPAHLLRRPAGIISTNGMKPRHDASSALGPLLNTEEAKQTVRDRIALLRKAAASESVAWTRTLLSHSADDFEAMLAANDPILLTMPIALEQMSRRSGQTPSPQAQ